MPFIFVFTDLTAVVSWLSSPSTLFGPKSAVTSSKVMSYLPARSLSTSKPILIFDHAILFCGEFGSVTSPAASSTLPFVAKL